MRAETCVFASFRMPAARPGVSLLHRHVDGSISQRAGRHPSPEVNKLILFTFWVSCCGATSQPLPDGHDYRSKNALCRGSGTAVKLCNSAPRPTRQKTAARYPKHQSTLSIIPCHYKALLTRKCALNAVCCAGIGGIWLGCSSGGAALRRARHSRRHSGSP